MAGLIILATRERRASSGASQITVGTIAECAAACRNHAAGLFHRRVGGILPATMGDIPLDFGTLEPHGCFIGSAAVIVLSDRDSMRDAALNLMRFFEDESCGQCTPCRVGTEKAVRIMSEKKWNRTLLDELAQAMSEASICGLGQAACNPLKQVMKHFPEDLA
jgi:formate dehydrogenase